MLCGPAIVNFLCLTSFNNHNNTKKLKILSKMGSRLNAARPHTFLAFSTKCSDHVNALSVMCMWRAGVMTAGQWSGLCYVWDDVVTDVSRTLRILCGHVSVILHNSR